MFKAILAVVIGAVLLIVVMTSVEKVTSNETPAEESQEVIDTNLTVSISGEVNKEGTYYIADGGKLSDLIAAAGGVTSNADERAYNVDYLLKNNYSFYIAPLYDTSETCAQIEITKVNINTASSEELQTINGVKSGIATNILAYRDGGGYFNRIEELENVDSIGPTVFSRMKDFVIIKWFSYLSF